ncbi:RsfA family transcriptional regulator [Bacillus sp. 03113]|uniref:RsfA family transcriptional regulator n=1 Tax=Bacillus sp. 03113 TaxID=2578211 RepID=UPI001141A54F|nr:RsfA family transcriptional regulator [Bacillus sp. 03113]
MSSTRQDAWSQDEDILLAEVVLRYIRDGGTQLEAFEKVGKQLSRTAAACGFRWNSFVRKQYKSGIELAKKQRKQEKQQVAYSVKKVEDDLLEELKDSSLNENRDFEEVIAFLREIYLKGKKTSVQQNKISLYDEKIHDLEKKTFYLAAENEKLKKELRMIEEDYKALIEIMERARKMVVLKEEDRQQKIKFQMDKNGNLERIQK